MRLIRQGDLLFVPVEAIPAWFEDQATKSENGVIAEGEATGHHHRIAALEGAEVFVHEGWRGREVFVKVGPNRISILHEEHHPVQLEPGTTYHVHRAREYDYLNEVARVLAD